MFPVTLDQRKVLITGGSRGIGAACARYLARAGAAVAVGYVQAVEEAQALVTALQNEGATACAVGGDLRQADQTAAVFDNATQALGGLDSVVVNAGIWQRASMAEMQPDQWQATMTANLDSTYHTCHQAAQRFQARGGGHIVTIASTAGQRGEAHYSHYAASKGGMIALTRSLAAELGPHGIRVNCVAPGWVRTGMTQHVFDDKPRHAGIIAEIPLRRIAEPEDIAGPVLFLLSDLARHVQGAVINVNGGSVLC